MPCPSGFFMMLKSSSEKRGPVCRSASSVSGYTGLLGAASCAAPRVLVTSRSACMVAVRLRAASNANEGRSNDSNGRPRPIKQTHTIAPLMH